jgi:hypothetical protein
MIIKQNDFNRWPRKCGAFSCIKVSIQPQGAELASIFNKENKLKQSGVLMYLGCIWRRLYQHKTVVWYSG